MKDRTVEAGDFQSSPSGRKMRAGALILAVVKRLATRLGLQREPLLRGFVAAAVVVLGLGTILIALVAGEWGAIAAGFGALSFALAFWLALRTHRAEEPNLRVFRIERIHQLTRSHQRQFAALFQVNVANLSRNGNAVSDLEAWVQMPDGPRVPTSVTQPVKRENGSLQFLVRGDWFTPPAGASETNLPTPVAAQSVCRLDLVFVAALDALIGSEALNALVMEREDVAPHFIYRVDVQVRDIFQRTYPGLGHHQCARNKDNRRDLSCRDRAVHPKCIQASESFRVKADAVEQSVRRLLRETAKVSDSGRR